MLLKALELMYKVDEEGTNNSHLFIRAIPNGCNYHKVANLMENMHYSKRMVYKYEDYSLDYLLKHVRIEVKSYTLTRG